MRLLVVAHPIGLILRWFGLILLLPLGVDLLYGDVNGAIGFAVAAAATSLCGEVLRRGYRESPELRRIEGIAVVAISWLIVAAFGAIPYVWSDLSVIDALFESMSGFTTTGATIIVDFGAHSRGLFFWRGLTQWLGGMGVIALFIAVLPALAIAGRQMFFAEAPGPEEDRLTPRIRHTAIALWSLYVGLTAIQVLLLVLVDMPLYDAVCNSFTTLAAGGFSPHPESIGGYQNPAAEWIFIVFIFLAGANYTLQYRAIRGDPGRLFKDEEFRTYTALVLCATLVITLLLWDFSSDLPAEYLRSPTSLGALNGATPLTLVRQAAFQVVTILTTAGFATDDFNLWSDAVKAVMLILMFIGGSAGSAGGGPKVVRTLLIAKYAGGELLRAVHPRVVRQVRYNGRVVPQRVLRAIVAFLLLYLMTYVISVLIIAGLGADLITAITACIATLGNIGPGFGAVGPMANYAHLPTASKFVLFLNMWIGRLEVLTVLVLLQPRVWRAARLRDRPLRPTHIPAGD